MRIMRSRHAALGCVLALSVIAGCNAVVDDQARSDFGVGAAKELELQSNQTSGVMKESARAVPAAPSPLAARIPARQAQVDQSQATIPAQIPVAGMIIRTGSAVVEVASLERAIAAMRGLALRLGGEIGNLSMATGQDQLRRATIELRIPTARFDDAVASLRPVGEVESVDVSAQDVGEEYVDISARVANGRRLEERLIRLLENRTGKLEEVLAVERELARVREEIDRMEGRLRWLRSRVAMSTLLVTVHEPAPLLSPPGENIIMQSFVNAWRNFVRFTAGLIAALGALIPLAAVGALCWWAGWKLWRRFGGSAARTAAGES